MKLQQIWMWSPTFAIEQILYYLFFKLNRYLCSNFAKLKHILQYSIIHAYYNSLPRFVTRISPKSYRKTTPVISYCSCYLLQWNLTFRMKHFICFIWLELRLIKEIHGYYNRLQIFMGNQITAIEVFLWVQIR